MRESLDDLRSGDEGDLLAIMHYRMRNLGIATTITNRDMYFMIRDLQTKRSLKVLGLTVPHLLFYMKGIGVDNLIVPEDEELMLKSLGYPRTLEDPGTMAMMHYLIRSLGVQTQLSRENVEFLRKGLDSAREDDNGVYVAHMHYYMPKIGLETAISEKDRKLMDDTLEKARTDRNGVKLALMHFFMQELPENPKDRENVPPIPPLKKFGGRV